MTWLDDLTLETVIVHLTHDGPSIKGLKRAVHDDGLILMQATVLEDEAVSVLNGDVFIPRERVLLMQLVDGG